MLQVFGLPIFSRMSFFMGPFAFLGVASFFIGGLCDKPLFIFWVAPFFIGGLCDKPLCVF
jgi:hypothetical protein